jgi:ribosomal protein L31
MEDFSGSLASDIHVASSHPLFMREQTIGTRGVRVWKFHLVTAAASTAKVKYGSFLASVHREISVELCKGNHAIFRAGVQVYSRASGHARLPGLLAPTDEVE